MTRYTIIAIIVTVIFFLFPLLLFYLMDSQSGVELDDLSNYPPTELQEELYWENQMEQQIYRPY